MPKSACSISFSRRRPKCGVRRESRPTGKSSRSATTRTTTRARSCASCCATAIWTIAKSNSKSARNASPMVEVFTPQGMEEMGLNMKDLMSQLMPKKTRTRKVKIPEAMELLTQEEAARLVDMEIGRPRGDQRAPSSRASSLSTRSTRSRGASAHGPDVSREGVQRDLLPIVEGSTVNTKYGAVKTDHILFVASGAFHTSKPSDLIPEFQGRFPIRVELKALTREDFIRILTEPENALTRQYVALMETEGVHLTFTTDAVARAGGDRGRGQRALGKYRRAPVAYRARAIAGRVVVQRARIARSRTHDRRRLRARPPRHNRQGRGPLALYSLESARQLQRKIYRRGDCVARAILF